MDDSQTHNGVPLDVTPDPQMPAPPVSPPPFPIVPPKLKEQGGAVQQVAEAAPVKTVEEPDKVAKEEGDEYWENYAREIELEKKIAEIGGMEKVESGEVPLPDQIAKEMGIKSEEKKETPAPKNTDFNVRGIALTDEQLGIGITKPTSSGLRWLVEWFIYQLLKAHFLVKKVKGRVLRYSP